MDDGLALKSWKPLLAVKWKVAGNPKLPPPPRRQQSAKEWRFEPTRSQNFTARSAMALFRKLLERKSPVVSGQAG